MASSSTLTGTYQVKMADVFIQPDGALTPFLFLECMGVGDITLPEGELTPVYCKDPDTAGRYKIRDKIQAEPGLPATTLDMFLEKTNNYLLSLRCPFDLRVDLNPCGVPASTNAWEKILYLAGLQRSSATVPRPASPRPAENVPLSITAPVSFDALFEINRIVASQLETTETSDATAVFFFNQEQCFGRCGAARSPCTIGFFATEAPYLVPATVWYTLDFGGTWAQTAADPFEGSESISDIVGLWPRVIVARGTNNLNKPAEIAYSEDYGATWTNVYLDAVNNGAVNALWWLNWERLWAAGDDGYIWFSSDGSGSWTTQTSGGLTVEDLRDIHVAENLAGAAVGDNNVLLLTTNGVNWTLGTGPAAGVNLNAVYRWSTDVIWVGAANGNLYYSQDGGTTWTAAAFAGAGTGSVIWVEFMKTNLNFGAMLHETAAGSGRLFRTVDGGYSWFMDNDNTPANAGLNDLHICPSFNDFYAVGDVVGTNPMILKYESQL